MRIAVRSLSTCRIWLMGLAALMIIACHARAYGVYMPGWARVILGWGNLGVDIFLLLSGLGCFYSLSRPGNTVKNFYRRRFVRIAVPYLLIFIPANFLFLLLGERNIGEALLSLTALEYWFFHKGAWFVSMIILLYLASPLLFKVLAGKRRWLVTAGIIVVVFGLSALRVQDTSNHNLIHNIQWAFWRSPSFFIGMALGKDCKDGKTIPAIWPVALALLFIPASMILDWVDNSWFIVPLLTMTLAVILERAVQFKPIEACLEFMGRISLESYLMNICLNALLLYMIPRFFDSRLFYGHFLEYTFVVVAGIAGAWWINNTVTSDRGVVRRLLKS